MAIAEQKMCGERRDHCGFFVAFLMMFFRPWGYQDSSCFPSTSQQDGGFGKST